MSITCGCKLVNHLSAPREEFERTRETTDPVAVIAFTHNCAYFFFTNFGFRFSTAKHILHGLQLLFFKFFLREPGFVRARAVALYALGAWWGLGDSLRASLAGRKDRLHREMEQRSKV